MEKKKLPLLRLKRETIRQLESPVLSWVAAGASVVEICGPSSGRCPNTNDGG